VVGNCRIDVSDHKSIATSPLLTPPFDYLINIRFIQSFGKKSREMLPPKGIPEDGHLERERERRETRDR